MVLNGKIEVNYRDELSSSLLSEYLKPFLIKDTVLMCIGTDKCIGDCLGPLVGTLLKKKPFPLPIYGTLKSPVHALNINNKTHYIKKMHPSSFIIAIDACLSDEDRIGNIEIRHGPIYPGKGIGKKLPPIGDLSIVGIVDAVNNSKNLSLHSIRLSFIMEMAEVICEAFTLAVNSNVSVTKRRKG